MDKTTNATRRAADEARQTYHFSTHHRAVTDDAGNVVRYRQIESRRAKSVLGPDFRRTIEMVPHSTPTARMDPDFARAVLRQSAPGDWRRRMDRNDWRARRAEERYRCAIELAKRTATEAANQPAQTR